MMAKITRFTLQQQKGLLIVNTEKQSFSFYCEYLRVFSPAQQAMKQALVGHKKKVKLFTIESLGSHGYRFIFDDNHTAIFNLDDLMALHQQYEKNWANYQQQLTQHHLTREPQITITNLS